MCYLFRRYGEKSRINFDKMFIKALNEAAIKTIKHPNYIYKLSNNMEKIND